MSEASCWDRRTLQDWLEADDPAPAVADLVFAIHAITDAFACARTARERARGLKGRVRKWLVEIAYSGIRCASMERLSG